MTVDQFMKTHQSEIKTIISELDSTFNSHQFIQKFSKVFEGEKYNDIVEQIKNDFLFGRRKYNVTNCSYHEMLELQNREAILCFGNNDLENQIINNVIIGKISCIYVSADESHLPVQYDIINAEGEIKKYDVFELKKVITLD